MALSQSPMPVRDAMVTPDDGLISRSWRVWLRSRADIVNSSPIRVGGVGLSGRHASIPATPIPGDFPAGLYRVSVLAYRTTIASGSSALGVVIRFVSGGTSRSVATPVSNVNTLAETVTGSWLIRKDPDSPITYEVAYGSVNADEMIYALDITVEQVEV